MTEAEWLACKEVSKMLKAFNFSKDSIQGRLNPPSQRKIKLFDDACFTLFGLTIDDVAVQTVQRPEWADLLRDVVGNPWRPVTLLRDQHCRACGGTGSFVVGSGEDAERMACRCCPWLTPQVLSLAQAAYKERIDDAKNATAETPPDRSPDRRGAVAAGAGIGGELGPRPLVSGTLDPLTLSALADAMEEAGCPTEENHPSVVKTGHHCPECGDQGFWRSGQEFDHMKKCRREGCGLVWVPDSEMELPRAGPHPLLAHLRSPGPHVRGCWAVDLILGKE